VTFDGSDQAGVDESASLGIEYGRAFFRIRADSSSRLIAAVERHTGTARIDQLRHAMFAAASMTY